MTNGEMPWYRKLWWLLKMTVAELGRHPAHRIAGALAFFSLFGLPALAVVLMLTVGTVYGDDDARANLLQEIEEQFGTEAGSTVASVLDNTPRPGHGQFSAGLFGLAALIFGATATYGHLQGVLNRIWAAPGRRGWWRLLAILIKRGLSFAMLLGLSLLLLAWMATSTLADSFPEDLEKVLPDGLVSTVSGGIDHLLSFLFGTAYFTLVFKVLPDTRVPWGAALAGGALTTILFGAIKGLVALYLGHTAVLTAYGAASSVIVMLVWFYAGSLVVVLGAVFGRAWARWRNLLQAVAG